MQIDKIKKSIRNVIWMLIMSQFFLLTKITYAQGLPNPLPVEDPNQIIVNVIKAFLGILGALALVIFIYGGFLLLISGGNTELVSKGKRTLVWAIIGLAIILSSYGIVSYLFDVII